MNKVMTFDQIKNGFSRMKSSIDEFIITTSEAIIELEGKVLSDSEYNELVNKLK